MHTEHVESEIQQLKKKMEEDNKQLSELANAFTKLKNNILGIEIEEEEMEVEDYASLLTNTFSTFYPISL